MKLPILLWACCCCGLAAAQVQPQPQPQPQRPPRATLPIAGQTLRVPVQPIKQAREATTVLQRYDFSCGSAAISTLLTHHYGQPVGEQQVLEAMWADGDQKRIQQEGFSMLDMKRYLATLGYAADGFEQPLEKLAEARLPAIVLLNEAGYHHFVVVKGVQPGRVLLGDPARGTRVMRRDAFDAAWVGKLLFVIHNRVGQARFNLAADWRVAPAAPLATGLPQEGLAGTGLLKHGAGDF
jgi:uncharacterized protein